MTGDNSLFSIITKINDEKVTFGDTLKGKIIGVDNIGCKSSPPIEKVFLVNSLKYNLPSIDQLCAKGYKIIFDHACCLILENDKILFVGNKKKVFIRLRLMHA